MPDGWHPDLRLGAAATENGIVLHCSSAKKWKGRLRFSTALHSDRMNLPVDYTRINQFQEWFIVEPTATYRLIVPEKPDKKIKGSKLIHGIKIRLAEAGSLTIRVEKKVPYPPDQRSTH